MEKTCAFPPCSNSRRTKSSLCNSHRSQKERGHELTAIVSTRSELDRFWSKVEKGAGCWNWTGTSRLDGYGSISIGGRTGKRWLAHRYSFELANGPIPAGAEIDHQCINRACVNPSHLRVVNSKQNMENRPGPNRNSKSGVRGVSWYKPTGKWHAQVMHNKKQHFVGYFVDIASAEAAVIAKRLELFTHNEVDRIAA